MSIYIKNPLADNYWDDLVARHPLASAFHQRGWLEALTRTYGYEPFVLTSSPPGKPLSDGIVMCRVSSWITGVRLVSLPFADHCELLLNDVAEYGAFSAWLQEECNQDRCRCFELRPLTSPEKLGAGLKASRSYCFHELDITPSLEEIFRGLHRDSIQRRIRRAEREHLSYETGRSERLLNDFFRLLLITRRRHRLPPQPRAWFRNLVEYMGENIQIRVARQNCIPIAAMVTLKHQSSVVYKYGCSDQRFHNLGAMPFLFWRLIEESKASGAERIDFGRSDLDNKGLITFKDRFGTTRRLLTYYRYPNEERGEIVTSHGFQGIRHLFSILPDAVLSTVGKVLYRHIG